MATQTMEEVQQNREEIIAAMRQMVGAEPIGDEVRPGDVVSRGDDDLDVQMVMGKGRSAGIVYIWDTKTGERSRTNANMLPTQLSKKREDGSKVFTTIDPRITPRRGTFKCLLHPNSPERDKYAGWGFAECKKDNLPSRQDVKSHMQNRHKREWATIEEERTRIERDEERELRLAAIAQNKATTAALLGPEKDGPSDRRRGREKDSGG